MISIVSSRTTGIGYVDESVQEDKEINALSMTRTQEKKPTFYRPR